jgi:protein-S-isoprenylcysteine O-methyltransferase Ste14
MFALVRALTYATLSVALILFLLPAGSLSWSGITRSGSIGMVQVAGIVVGAAGAALAVWCVLTFAFLGKGTPAPFDPPRRLVVRGPYRAVRNPMGIGVGLALFGASLFYQSLALFGFTTLFFLAIHLFVVLYEEPTLRRQFGSDYEAYTQQVRRWWPRLSR